MHESRAYRSPHGAQAENAQGERRGGSTGLTLAVLLVAWSVATAHHSYAMFDRSTTKTVSGTVRTFQWTNPHVYLWMYGSGSTNSEDVYAFEFGGGPNGLLRNGWTSQTLKPGDRISVTYNPLRDGRNGGGFVSVVLPDGTKINSNGVIGEGGSRHPSSAASR